MRSCLVIGGGVAKIVGLGNGAAASTQLNALPSSAPAPAVGIEEQLVRHVAPGTPPLGEAGDIIEPKRTLEANTRGHQLPRLFGVTRERHDSQVSTAAPCFAKRREHQV